MKNIATFGFTAVLSIAGAVAAMNVAGLSASFFKFSIADLLNLLAITVGVFVITRVLDQQRSRDALLKTLALEIVDRNRDYTQAAVARLEAAVGQTIGLHVGAEGRELLVEFKKGSQQLQDLHEVLNRLAPPLSECQEEKDLSHRFEALREYVTDGATLNVVTPSMVTDTANMHRKFEQALLSLRLKIIEH